MAAALLYSKPDMREKKRKDFALRRMSSQQMTNQIYFITVAEMISWAINYYLERNNPNILAF